MAGSHVCCGTAVIAAVTRRKASCAPTPGVDRFDIYDGPVDEALVADQLDFLRRHLL